MSVVNDRIILGQIIDKHHQDRAPDLKIDEYFEIFIAEQVLKDYDLSYDELFEGNPGGGQDGGIDGIHIFVNGVWVDQTNIDDFTSLKQSVKIDLFIIQAKNKTSFEEVVIDKFIAVTEDLFNLTTTIDDLSVIYNSDVIKATEKFRTVYSALSHTFPEINITYIYATKGSSPTENMERKANKLEIRVKELIRGSIFRFDFLGATELLDLSRQLPKTTFKLQIAEGPITSQDSASFIALIRLDDYYTFITDERGELVARLFEANVRDWYGDNKVNKQIKQSLDEQPVEDFWWLNNGVTILATKVTMTGGKTLQIENPEIVNGLQTSRAIYQYFSRSNVSREDERKLLVRVIVVSDEKESREHIIRATNNQTPVPDEALRSLDRIHRNIELSFLSQTPPLYYDRRRNYYKNQGKPANQIIGIKKLAQSVIATLLFKPDDARGRPSDYLRTADNDQYRAVFNQDYPPQMYYFCARFYQHVDDLLKSDGVDQSYDNSLRRSVRFHIMTHIILQHTKLHRNMDQPPAHIIAQQQIGEIDVALMLNSANRVLELLSSQRRQQERFRWGDFERLFFEDLDKVMGRS